VTIPVRDFTVVTTRVVVLFWNPRYLKFETSNSGLVSASQLTGPGGEVEGGPA
jgi:hypothetical protein